MEPTRYERKILFWLRLIATLCVLTLCVLYFKFKLSTQIERDVVATQARAKHTEELLLSFIDRSLEKWDQLQKDNQHLKVPSNGSHNLLKEEHPE